MIRSNRFNEKVVIVTGGGTGIGKGCALSFAEEGSIVVIAGRREAPLKETVEEIRSKQGKADYYVVDISKSDQVHRLVEDTVNQYGKLDVMVADAAVCFDAPIEETTDADVDRLVDINVKGTYYSLREAIRVMKKQGFGSVVTVSSGSGLMGLVNNSLYCATKAAIVNMVRALGFELAPTKIRVNDVAPGIIDTPMPRGRAALTPDPEGMMKALNERVPMLRLGQPSEVANLVLFLASEEASYITGSIHTIDGGFCAGK